ncbi:MAG: TadE family protein [Candidatus Hydrogenedentota bacterium]
MAILRPRHERDERGLASVEMAIVSLVLVMLTFGCMEYGWMFFRLQQVSNVSREAVRTAVLPDSVDADVTARVAVIMGGFGMGSTSYTLTTIPASVLDADAQDPVTVTVAVPYSQIGLTGMPIFPTPANLTSSATMSREGP